MFNQHLKAFQNMKKTKIYIETYGCQMNKLDSEKVHAILADDGFLVVNDTANADVILLNTCAVRDNAEQRIHGRIGELFALRANNPDLFFGVIGCMGQRLGEQLLSGHVRLVAGPDSYDNLPDMIRTAANDSVVTTDLSDTVTYETIEPIRKSPVSAWIDVMRGCNNFCSYCVVPYTRGRERSLSSAHIVSEITRLKDNGWREITLLGQNVNSYRDGEIDFAELLRKVSDTGIDWIRFLTSHPKDLTDDIIKVIAERNNVCPHLHLPLQSGSDNVLRAMNRGYIVSGYLDIVRKARELVKGISITTDLIFGFPGETEEDYQATIDVMKKVTYDFCFLYRYSEREGTRACDLPGNIPEHIRIERLKHAIDLQNSITAEKNRNRIGSIVQMLIKSRSKDKRGWFGFTDTNIPVVAVSSSNGLNIGSLTEVYIESTTGASLKGNIL